MCINLGKSNFNKSKRAVLALSLTTVLLLITMSFLPFVPVVSAADGDGVFTIAITPDTQNETTSSTEISQQWLSNRAQYLSDNKSSLDLRFDVCTGDMCNWPAYDANQLVVADAGMDIVEAAGIPWLNGIGNHDTKATGVGGSAGPGDAHVNIRDTTAYMGTFPLSRFPGIVTYEGKVDNSYRTFTAEGKNWLVLALEFCPRAAAVTWAAGVVASHPDYNVIITTHYYLNSDGTLGQSNDGYGDNSPQYIFDNLVKLYSNIKFVFCGHVGSAATLTQTGNSGNKIVAVLGCFHSGSTNPVDLVTINTNNNTASTYYYGPYNGTTFPSYTWSFTGMNYVNPSSSSSIVVNDNFDTDTTGGVPSGWTAGTSGGTVAVDNTPSATEKSIKLYKSGTANSATATRDFASQTGTVTIETSVRANETSTGWKAMPYMKNSAGTDFAGIGFNSGNIYALNGGGTTLLQAFTANSWYNIKMILNISAQTYDVYINGALMASNQAFAASVTEVSKAMYNESPGVSGTVYVNYLKVAKSPMYCDEEFDTTATGAVPAGWSATTTGGTVAVVEDPSASNKSLKLYKSGTANNAGAVYNLSDKQVGILTMEEKVKTDEITGGWKSIGYLKSSAGTDAIDLAFNNGSLIAMNGTTGTTIQTITAGTWYTVKVILNTDTDKYDIYVDGTLKASQLNFYNAASDIGKVQYWVGVGANGTVYADYVKLYS